MINDVNDKVINSFISVAEVAGIEKTFHPTDRNSVETDKIINNLKQAM